jgi:hypothetical protein
MDLAEEQPAMLRIELVYSLRAGEVQCIEMTLAKGSRLIDALQRSGVLSEAQAAHPGDMKVGIWGRLAPLDTELRSRDRVEIYRSLTVDPKEARRLRYRSPVDKSKRVRPKPQPLR